MQVVAYRIEEDDEAILLKHRTLPSTEFLVLYRVRRETMTKYDEIKTYIFRPSATLSSKVPDLN